MFLCTKCHDSCQCFASIMPSFGACEVCKNVGACADCHAPHRPKKVTVLLRAPLATKQIEDLLTSIRRT